MKASVPGMIWPMPAVKGFGLDCRVTPIHTDEFPQKALRPKYSVLDKSKIKRDFGLAIRHYSEGLSDCIRKIKGI